MALGGFGFYHFGKKAEKTRQQETQNSFDKLLTQNQELNDQLKPFLQLAQAARPDLDQGAALTSLRKEIEQLRQVAEKHEFTPLEPALRNVFVQRVQEFSLSFSDAGVAVKITHETWSPTTTKQYAAQLASLLREGGLEVQGPDQITYFLVTPSSPIEWGYNDGILDMSKCCTKQFLQSSSLTTSGRRLHIRNLGRYGFTSVAM